MNISYAAHAHSLKSHFVMLKNHLYLQLQKLISHFATLNLLKSQIVIKERSHLWVAFLMPFSIMMPRVAGVAKVPSRR